MRIGCGHYSAGWMMQPGGHSDAARRAVATWLQRFYIVVGLLIIALALQLWIAIHGSSSL